MKKKWGVNGAVKNEKTLSRDDPFGFYSIWVFFVVLGFDTPDWLSDSKIVEMTCISPTEKGESKC